MNAHTVLTHLAHHPGQGPARIAKELGGTTPRAVQRILARLRAMDRPLVAAEGEASDRAYYVTPAGRAAATDPGQHVPVPAPWSGEDKSERRPPQAPPTQPSPNPHVPAPPVSPERAALQRVSSILSAAGIPTIEAGRVVPIEDRVRVLIEERDAADTRVDDEVRRRILSAFEGDPRLRYLAAVLRPDDLLRAVVEAGVAALTDRAPAYEDGRARA